MRFLKLIYCLFRKFNNYYEILADSLQITLPRFVTNMTTKLIKVFGTIIRVHLQSNKKIKKNLLLWQKTILNSLMTEFW